MNTTLTLEGKELSSIDKLIERGLVKVREVPYDTQHPFYSEAYNIDREDFKKENNK